MPQINDFLSAVDLVKLLNGSCFAEAKPELRKLVKCVCLIGDKEEWQEISESEDSIRIASRALINVVENLYRPYAEKEIELMFDEGGN